MIYVNYKPFHPQIVGCSSLRDLDVHNASFLDTSFPEMFYQYNWIKNVFKSCFHCFILRLFVIWSSKRLHSFLKLSHPSPFLTPIYYLPTQLRKESRVNGIIPVWIFRESACQNVDFEENLFPKYHLLCTFVCSNRGVAIWEVCPSSDLAIGPVKHHPGTAQAPEINIHFKEGVPRISG